MSLQRLIEQSKHRDEYRKLIMLLTMLHAADFTHELLTSCAEASLAGVVDSKVSTLLEF